MFDVVEIRNLDGEKINVHLDENKSGQEELGEWHALIRIANEPYLLVAEPVETGGDLEGREWKLLSRNRKVVLPDSFFEKHNVAGVMQMITPFVGEEKLVKIQAILEGVERV